MIGVDRRYFMSIQRQILSDDSYFSFILTGSNFEVFAVLIILGNGVLNISI